MRLFATGVVVLMALDAFAGNEVFEKWQTPSGTLHIGSRPPTGSVLLERIELAVADQPPAIETAAIQAPIGALADAARDGREIMRQRAAAREAERDRDLARDLDRPEVIVESSPSLLFVSGGVHGRRHHRRDGFRPRLGIGPSPVSGSFRPNESARRMAPPF